MNSNQDSHRSKPIIDKSKFNFNPSSAIKDSEDLFRAVRDWPRFWKKKGILSPAAFKDPKGLSLDRSGDRNVETVIEHFHVRKFDGTLISLNAKDCKDLRIFLKPKPKNWPYHILALESETEIVISDEKCDKLRQLAKKVVDL
jgi:hypothetical protein